MTTTTTGHLIHFVNKQQRRVVRATFTAELLNGCDTQDLGFLLAVILHEMLTGTPSAAKARQLRELLALRLQMSQKNVLNGFYDCSNLLYQYL